MPGADFTVGRLPRITFGGGSFAEVPAIVARHGRAALLVTGARSLGAAGRLEALRAGLSREGVAVGGEVTIAAEPSVPDVEEALDRHRAAGIDVVLGIGGGSVIDAAKAIAGLLRAGSGLMDHLEGVGRGLPYRGPSLPVVAVPTTAGTGSEATRNAVLTVHGREGYKRSFRDERLVPVEAIVDGELLAGLPRRLIASNGIDALTQLLEAFVSRRASPFTDGLAREGLAAARDGLLAWHAEPGGPGAPGSRAHMALASLLSGICLANAGLGAVHGLASPLGAFWSIPHGMACGAVLWQTVRANIDALEARAPASRALVRYAEVGRLLSGDVGTGTNGEEARRRLVAVLRDWTMRLEVPSLSEWGVTPDDLGPVVAESRGSSMRTNPVELEDGEIEGILRAAL